MFNIKVFPDFRSSAIDDYRESAMLDTLIAVRKSCGAKYVNASIFDYQGQSTEAVHFLTYPTSWISRYVTNFYSDIDPLFQLDFRAISFVDWQDLYREKPQANLFREFSENDLGQNAVTVVNHVEQEVFCVLTVTLAVCDNDWARYKAENMEVIRFNANTVGETYNRLYRHDRRTDYKITPRECECLYWVAMGKTDDQIGALLNIGKWTVNGHLQSAKYKLGTPSRSAAVARAIVDGIITLRRAV